MDSTGFVTDTPWTAYSPHIVCIMNSSPSKATNASPLKMMFGMRHFGFGTAFVFGSLFWLFGPAVVNLPRFREVLRIKRKYQYALVIYVGKPAGPACLVLAGSLVSMFVATVALYRCPVHKPKPTNHPHNRRMKPVESRKTRLSSCVSVSWTILVFFSSVRLVFRRRGHQFLALVSLASWIGTFSVASMKTGSDSI